jgi:hypothetical protein
MSTVTRSVSITIYNGTSKSLTCTPGNGSTFPARTLPPYQGTTYSDTNTSEALEGSINVATSGLNWSLWYKASSNSDNTYYRTDAMTGSLYTYQEEEVSDHAVTVRITLYEGVPAGTGYVLKLATAADIAHQMAIAPWVFHDFVENMFADGVRNITDAIVAEVPNISSSWASQNPRPRPPVFYADMTGGQIPNIVQILANYWMDTTSSCGDSDKGLINFFKKFLTYGYTSSLSSTTIPQIYIPRIDSEGFYPSTDANSKLAILKLDAYDNLWIQGSGNLWARDVVEIFLTLVVAGAHFVTLRYSGDGIDAKFVDAMDFRKQLTAQLKNRGANGNSHYRDDAPFNGTGYYYLDITGETLPEQIEDQKNSDTKSYPGLLISLLTALTNSNPYSNSYNTFFQLEGWPAHGITDGGDRHHADYQASTDTYWNISTFAASPYSEKRATTVFIAPPGWVPVVTQTTRMMPYYGAWGSDENDPEPQPWLQTDLIEIDETTAATLTLFQ